MHQDTNGKSLATTITSSQLEQMLARVSSCAGPTVLAAHPTAHMLSREHACLQVSGGTTDTMKEEERLRLKQMSDERASKWPNTLQVGTNRRGFLASLRVKSVHTNSPCTTANIINKILSYVVNVLQAARARKERVRQEKAAAEEAVRQEVCGDIEDISWDS